MGPDWHHANLRTVYGNLESVTSEPEERFSGNDRTTLPRRLPADITQEQAIKAFERGGGVRRRSKRGHAVLKMSNGRLVSLPSGKLKRGLLESQIKRGGLTVDTFLGFL